LRDRPPPAPPAFYVEDVPRTRRRAWGSTTGSARTPGDALRTGRPEQARKYLLKLGTANPIREAGLAYADLSPGTWPPPRRAFKSLVAGTGRG